MAAVRGLEGTLVVSRRREQLASALKARPWGLILARQTLVE